MREQKPFRRVVLSKCCMNAIRRETLRFWVKETGGALVGYVDESSSCVVVAASGPGPRAMHSYSDVQLDGQFITRYCEQWRAQSHGVIEYVGDWHTHVSNSVAPSQTDVEAMRRMAPFTASPSFPPISLIVARFTHQYNVFVLQNSKLVTVRPEEMEDYLTFPRS
jgi:integrative and conjugative element protein (TIGR02256 family)